MNASLLCCAAILAGAPPDSDRIDELFGPTAATAFAAPEVGGVPLTGRTVVRGQTPSPYYDGSSGPQPTYSQPYSQPNYSQPTYSQPPVYSPNGSPGPVFGGGMQPLADPFISGGPAAVVDYVPGTTFPFGMFRLGPPHLGGNSQADFGFLSGENIEGGGRSGDFQITEFDLESRHVLHDGGGWILSLAGQYGARFWEGPPGGFGLPSDVHHFGADIEWRTAPDGGPWGAVVAFNPSLNTDFDTNIRGDAYNWDGRGYLTYQHSATLAFVGGIGYLDRVNDRVLPYGGVIWKPDSRWEIHATVPEARISYFLGNGGGGSRWIYARAEYHVEAYQVETSGASRGGYRQTDKIELQDYRLLLGYAHSNGYVDAFIEAGWVLGRETDFLSDTVPDFDIDDGFIGRVGIRF